MLHRIRAPDPAANGKHRPVLWDDIHGTVRGEHSKVPEMQARLALPTPVVYGDVIGSLTLDDPRHDPPDFVALLLMHVDEPALPATLRDVVPTAWDVNELPDGAVA